MPIIVHSPFSGRPVKIRDEDVGRAVRDEENRIFYVLERADGSGHYGAPTRSGNPRDEQRYDELVAKMKQAKASGQEQSQLQIHDARGKGRPGSLLRKFVILVLLLIIAAAAYLFFSGQLDQLLGRQQNSPAPQQQSQPQPQLPAPSQPPVSYLGVYGTTFVVELQCFQYDAA
jgi:hypothetical protein